jgi:hypothetical protein
MSDALSDLRREAASLGLAWSDVQPAYQELKAAEWDRRQRPNEIRAVAWQMATASTPGSWPFWRHGFVSRWGRLVERSDYTAVPAYDEIAQEIATEFPEYGGDDGTERLWDFLLSPYDRMPPAEQLYRQAIRRVASGAYLPHDPLPPDLEF